ncbi:MAG: hypothetical protein IJW74_03190 [Oscillospiraceae bacterium]|nr:hypothetical protein [Oscillospiraceae bacterium]
MERIVTTAIAEYRAGLYRKAILSNSHTLFVLAENNFLCGDVLCKSGRHCWKLRVFQKDTNTVAFTLSGCKAKGFCFELDSESSYRLLFKSDCGSVLRLYNTPDNVTDIMHCEAL